MLSAALDQFAETQISKDEKPLAKEGTDEKSQISQLTSRGEGGDGGEATGDDPSGEVGSNLENVGFESDVAKLIQDDKGAKAVMMLLGQVSSLITSAATAAAPAAVQGQGQGAGGGTAGGGATSAGGNGGPPATVKLNGLTLLQTECTDAELGTKDVQLSHYNRGSTDIERIKIRKQHCAALPHKFNVMKVAEILAAKSKVTIGSELLAQQIATDWFSEWSIKVDVANVLWVPDITDFSNPAIVAAAPRKFLLKDWKGICKESVTGWQEFIHRWCKPADINNNVA
jgi:hypothetical protein